MYIYTRIEYGMALIRKFTLARLRLLDLAAGIERRNAAREIAS